MNTNMQYLYTPAPQLLSTAQHILAGQLAQRSFENGLVAPTMTPVKIQNMNSIPHLQSKLTENFNLYNAVAQAQPAGQDYLSVYLQALQQNAQALPLQTDTKYMPGQAAPVQQESLDKKRSVDGVVTVNDKLTSGKKTRRTTLGRARANGRNSVIPAKKDRVRNCVYVIGKIKRKWDGRQFRRLCQYHECSAAARGCTQYCVTHSNLLRNDSGLSVSKTRILPRQVETLPTIVLDAGEQDLS